MTDSIESNSQANKIYKRNQSSIRCRALGLQLGIHDLEPARTTRQQITSTSRIDTNNSPVKWLTYLVVPINESNKTGLTLQVSRNSSDLEYIYTKYYSAQQHSPCSRRLAAITSRERSIRTAQ